jgi:hypothetical protein
MFRTHSFSSRRLFLGLCQQRQSPKAGGRGESPARLSCRKISLALMSLGAVCVSPPAQAQFAPSVPNETVIIIGDSPDQWEFYNNYWNELMLQRRPTPEVESPRARFQDNFFQQNAEIQDNSGFPGMSGEAPAPSPLASNADTKALSKNLLVRNLRLNPIIKLNGSSQLFGVLTNRNSVPVVVSGVNFEIRDRRGGILQTGTARPAPSLLAPGQSVTFSETLITVPPDIGAQVRLIDPAFILSPAS